MNIEIDKKLKSLRKSKGVTQEDFAKHLEISTQAVSKWERGESYPDITLLPNIALYYNVSIDYLLGLEEATVKAKIKEYDEQAKILANKGEAEDLLALWREAQKEFPNNLDVLQHLMEALHRVCNVHGMNIYIDEMIQIGERLLEESTVNEHRYTAIQILCYTYQKINNDEKAKEYAKMAPMNAVCSDILLSRILRKEEGIIHCQESLKIFWDTITNLLKNMLNNSDLNLKDRIKVLEFNLDLFQLLYEDGDLGFYEERVAEICSVLAHYYELLKDDDKALMYLTKMVEHIIKFETQEGFQHTSFMINRISYDPAAIVRGHAESYSQRKLRAVERTEAFNGYRSDKRYLEVIKGLKSLGDNTIQGYEWVI